MSSGPVPDHNLKPGIATHFTGLAMAAGKWEESGAALSPMRTRLGNVQGLFDNVYVEVGEVVLVVGHFIGTEGVRWKPSDPAVTVITRDGKEGWLYCIELAKVLRTHDMDVARD